MESENNSWRNKFQPNKKLTGLYCGHKRLSIVSEAVGAPFKVSQSTFFNGITCLPGTNFVAQFGHRVAYFGLRNDHQNLLDIMPVNHSAKSEKSYDSNWRECPKALKKSPN